MSTTIDVSEIPAERVRIQAHAALVKEVTDACVAALGRGLNREQVSAALAKIQELLDAEEE